MTKLSNEEKVCNNYWTKIYLRGLEISKEKQKQGQKISPEEANYYAKIELDKKIRENDKQLTIMFN